jgi:ADP-ribose pyrophosphatase YjhB (NUDIX family)
VIVDDQQRALLIRRRDNLHWEPPGGILERDESIQAGVCREVKEETGLSVLPLSLSGVYKNMKRGIIALVFRCHVLGGELAINDEVSEFRWATREEIASLADEGGPGSGAGAGEECARIVQLVDLRESDNRAAGRAPPLAWPGSSAGHVFAW